MNKPTTQRQKPKSILVLQWFKTLNRFHLRGTRYISCASTWFFINIPKSRRTPRETESGTYDPGPNIPTIWTLISISSRDYFPVEVVPGGKKTSNVRIEIGSSLGHWSSRMPTQFITLQRAPASSGATVCIFLLCFPSDNVQHELQFNVDRS